MTQQRPNDISNLIAERPVLDLSALRPTGILWAINRHIFHPRGYAFALNWPDGANPDTDRPDGFTIYGDGLEPWNFQPDTDDGGFTQFQAFIAGLNEATRP